MLTDMSWRFDLDEHDWKYYDQLLPQEHPLLDAVEKIDWEAFIPDLEVFYCRDRGQPAFPPLLMFKLEFLRYFCRLSDREVITRSESDVVFRVFLQIPVRCRLPDASLLTKFRGRLGVEGFKKMFTRLVACARQANLIRDRLRLKDGSHVIANITVPSTLTLVAQLREKLIDAIGYIDPNSAVGFQIEADRIREETATAPPDIRLEARIKLIQDILHWIAHQTLPPKADSSPDWERLGQVRQLAEKILDDQAHPENGRRTLSVVDPDARTGKHHVWYNGYVLDVMMDADSQLITAMEVLEAGGDEAMIAVKLVTQEQSSHDNHIKQLSIDGVGFNGAMLRSLEDPEGLNVDVYTPPATRPESDLFPSSAFQFTEDSKAVICPAGETSCFSQVRDEGGSVIYRFKRDQCARCPLLAKCKTTKLNGVCGRSVTKNKYEVEYERARVKSQTAAYAAIRQEHPAIERKLNEILNHHRGRRARYWGIAKVRQQETMTCIAINVKRILKLVLGEVCFGLR